METTAPGTKAVLLEGLQRALQERIAKIWTTVSLAGEPEPGPRFTKGLEEAVVAYRAARAYINANVADD